MKKNMLGYVLDCNSVSGCVDGVFAYLKAQIGKKSSCAWLACFNPHSYAVALNDKTFSNALHNADWLVPDGSGAILASRLLGCRINERVTGSDIFFGLSMLMNEAGGMSVFFLGATEETLSLIRGRMASDYPKIHLSGTYSPPYKSNYSPNEVNEIINAINLVEPDVLWVGMTAPKQEKWIYENRARLNVKFAGAIGAVFDFYSGRVKRSHPLFQRFGLEWLPRLIQQPRRLWRRTFLSVPIFLLHVFKARLSIDRSK